MPRVTIDFSEVEEFEALPKDDYLAVIKDVEYRPSQTEEKYDYLNVEYEVSDGEYKGRKTWQVWSLSPKALWRFKQSLENLGIVDEEIEIDYDEDTMKVTQPELVGMPVLLTLGHRPYEGRVQNEVLNVTAPDASDIPRKKGAKAPAKKAGPKKTASAPKKFK